ncbi:MAG: murein biosynthesis integral membrane protein MurJ [Rickettsiales bacterium]|jgi:putative peptidoglycan lipid II flippase|nr:murein biosynthesis integral membrane protein MurJ [Rickettsiales bacterium]
MSFFKKIVSFSAFTFISRIFGLVRDTVIAYKVGAGFGSDIFFVAVRAPNFLRAIFAEGAFTQAFIPMYNKVLRRDKEASSKFANNVYFILLVIVIITVVVLEIFMDKFMFLFAPGFANDPEKFTHLVLISRIIFPYLIFISICCLFSAILNSYHKYTPTAIVPIITNIFLISSVFLLFDYTQDHILSLALAFVSAGVVQIIYLIYHLRKINQRLQPKYTSITSDEKQFFRKILPAIIGASVVQLNLWIDTIFASLMDNVVSYYNYSERMINLPVALIVTSITIVLLPSLTQAIQSDNQEDIKKYNKKSMHLSLALVLPSAIGLYFLANPIIYTLFTRGAFTLDATANTALILQALAFYLPPVCMMRIINTNFFARSNTTTPMRIAFVLMVLNILFNFVFVQLFSFVGIAIATSLVSWIGVFISLYIIGKKHENLFEFSANIRFYLNLIISVIIMAIVIILLRDKLFAEFNLSEISKIINLFIIIAFGAASYLVTNILLFGSIKKFQTYF